MHCPLPCSDALLRLSCLPPGSAARSLRRKDRVRHRSPTPSPLLQRHHRIGGASDETLRHVSLLLAAHRFAWSLSARAPLGFLSPPRSPSKLSERSKVLPILSHLPKRHFVCRSGGFGDLMTVTARSAQSPAARRLPTREARMRMYAKPNQSHECMRRPTNLGGRAVLETYAIWTRSSALAATTSTCFRRSRRGTQGPDLDRQRLPRQLEPAGYSAPLVFGRPRFYEALLSPAISTRGVRKGIFVRPEGSCGRIDSFVAFCCSWYTMCPARGGGCPSGPREDFELSHVRATRSDVDSCVAFELVDVAARPSARCAASHSASA